MSIDPTANMSSGPERLPMTIPGLMEHKRRGEPLVMVTCYDYPSARIVEEAGVDLVLVGDTAAMTVLGYDSTVSVTVDELLVLVKAVRRGLRTPLLVGDLPFGSYEVSDEQAVTTAQRFVKEARCDAVKLEGGGVMAQRARAIASTGIPVVGHVGLTPQTATAVGGFKAQGRTSDRALQVVQDALALQDAMRHAGIEARVQSALRMDQVVEPYIRPRAIRQLEEGKVVIFAAGTGNPFFTTDTAAALRGSEIGAEVVLKATKVDGVYSADPKKDSSATRYSTISFDEAIGKNLQVMDATAFALCRDQKLPIRVFSINKAGALKRIVQGEDEGTLVHV